MLEKLTNAQEASIPKYVDYGRKIGLDTTAVDIEKAKEAVTLMYRCGGLTPPPDEMIKFIPGGSWVSAVILARELGWNDGDKDFTQSDFCYGHHDAELSAWAGFYTQECEKEVPMLKSPHDDNVLLHQGLVDASETCGWILALDGGAIICDKPYVCTLKDGLAHNDTGPYVAWRDGIKLFALNGVIVPEWLVMTEPEHLTFKQYQEMENQEQQREFIRKVGWDLFSHMAKFQVIDTDGDYELLDSDGMRFLKMINPSIGVFHVEGVTRSCRTVDDANKFRTRDPALGKLRFSPDGAGWFQQGDKLFIPHGAKAIKPRPEKLT